MPSLFKEYGAVGQRRYSGIFSEEFLHDLQGKRGIEIYREMADNDDTCGAILYAIETLIRQASWTVQPGGPLDIDQECADFIDSCMHDMQDTWTDTISEILSFLTFGWSYHEIVYKRRTGDSRDPRLNSKFSDGLIGWQKLPIRSQETLYRWEYDENDNLTGMTQLPPPRYQLATIPIEKALHFRTKSRKNNPEGRSIFRTAYRCFDEETEILTANGWMKGTELTGDEELATLNPLTLVLEYERPSEIHRYRHDGEMLRFESRYIDQLVTPNHRMWVRQYHSETYGIREAADVARSDRFMTCVPHNDADAHDHIIPGITINHSARAPITVDEQTWAAFMGIFLSEGCAYRKESGNRQCVIAIVQKKPDVCEKLRALLGRLPFHVYEHKSANGVISFEISNLQLYEHLKDTKRQTQRGVPGYVRAMSRAGIKTFLEWYALGDGSRAGSMKQGYRGTQVLMTASERMADDLQELALLAGYASRKRFQRMDTCIGGKRYSGGIWYVSLGKPMEHKASKTAQEYHGEIWCPTTRNGIVLIRRNGKPSWSGNCWYFKRRIQEIEGMGIERDLAGLPVLIPPEGFDIWDANDPAMVQALTNAETIVRNIRRDATEGIVLPFGWTLQLMTSGGRRQFDTNQIIERYDTRIAMTTLADFMLLGHQSVGSFALSDNKTKLFSMALGSYLDIICETFNSQAIPRLIMLNTDHFNGITDYPRLTHGDVESPNLQELGAYIHEMTGCGAIITDEALEDYLREIANLPERMEDQQFDRTMRGNNGRTPNNPDKPQPDNIDLDEISDADDARQASEAQKRLKR